MVFDEKLTEQCCGKLDTATPARSRSISGKLPILTIESFLSLTLTELKTQSSKRNYFQVSSSNLAQIQTSFLKQYGIDPKTPLDVLVNTVTATELQKATKEYAAVSFPQPEQQAKLFAAQKEALQQELQEMRTLQQKLLSIQEKQASLMQLQSDAVAAASGLAPDQLECSTSLRVTGLQEDAGEQPETLLNTINTVLGSLTSKVTATDACRHGRPNARDGRAVEVKFASAADCMKVLRTKSQLSRSADFRQISIDVMLTHAGQQQKHALWPMYMQAKQGGARATWRGCRLYIDGEDATLPIDGHVPVHCDQMGSITTGSPTASACAPWSQPHMHAGPSTAWLHPHRMNPLYQRQQPPQQTQPRTSSVQRMPPRLPSAVRA